MSKKNIQNKRSNDFDKKTFQSQHKFYAHWGSLLRKKNEMERLRKSFIIILEQTAEHGLVVVFFGLFYRMSHVMIHE